MTSTTTDPQRDERLHLEYVQNRLEEAISRIDTRLKQYRQNIQDQKNYLWESRADMDHVEKVTTRQSIEQMLMTGETILVQKQQLQKLARSPYFGRFDFTAISDSKPAGFYIGVNHFYDEGTREHLIYDWRAPVATLFYDFEIGPAAYQSPSGRIEGTISLKRQFRIRAGVMEMMLETDLHIVDDVLQKELAGSADAAMKNIVATIQRDQNAIIRNEDAPTLIIQGVAGSGKTSIALHRIAFLLYRFKESLKSTDILIISPNKVFADYIANVLPELGEESIAEIGMEDLAHSLLDNKVPFQTFFEQTSVLLETNDEKIKERIQNKSSAQFLKKLGEYADYIEKSRFTAQDIVVAGHPVPAWFIEKHFSRYRGLPPAQRITEVVKAVEVNMGIYYNVDLGAEDKRLVRAALNKMYRKKSLNLLYKEFFDWLGKPDLFVQAKGRKLEYADVFPLIYLKMRLENVDNPYRAIKHLVIDEMQDYTPVQFAVLARLFNCRKTILGDVAQAVNPYSASQLKDIEGAFTDATLMTLTKSYRSTLQIMEFSQQICFNPQLIPMRRHGDVPTVHRLGSAKEETTWLKTYVTDFIASEHSSLGIICKTQKQAQQITNALIKNEINACLLDPSSRVFSTGIIVCSAHMAKGLEFDRVVIPSVNTTNYHTEMDRNMLYVACTRAMHRLILTYTGDPSIFLKFGEE
ncbi:MAG: AAA family ATPase [Desulfuromonadales bacterium]|nr:AAA family ATPase [Desulfuromonadales bacterium]